ncbi:MAG: hypothetical protein HY046_03110 [Acidobacteria bacterium]|nr:hypothetical protein [Acidobacteriota bacterium]
MPAMGRSSPSFVEQIHIEAARWRDFRNALPRDDRPYFDAIFRRIRAYTPAGMYQCHANPFETILFAFLLAQEKRITALERKFGIPDDTPDTFRGPSASVSPEGGKP